MPLGRPTEPDRYGKRIALAGALGLLILVLLPLLGPSPERVHQYLLGNVGVEGPTLILDRIEVLPDEDERTVDPQLAMPTATQGVTLPPELSKPVEDAETRRERTEPDPGKTAAEHWTRRILPDQGVDADRTRPEMHGQTQRTLDFVLDRFVAPVYPEAASAQARERVVLVMVALWVNPEGVVEHAYIESSDGGSLFDDAVIKAVLQWRYRPVVRDRAPEGFWDRQMIRFVVNGDEVKAELLEG